MAIKKRTIINTNNQIIENLANELADKPYGQKQIYNNMVRTTITLPASVLFKLEDMARTNKRGKEELRSVSAIIRYCIERCLNI